MFSQQNITKINRAHVRTTSTAISRSRKKVARKSSSCTLLVLRRFLPWAVRPVPATRQTSSFLESTKHPPQVAAVRNPPPQVRSSFVTFHRFQKRPAASHQMRPRADTATATQASADRSKSPVVNFLYSLLLDLLGYKIAFAKKLSTKSRRLLSRCSRPRSRPFPQPPLPTVRIAPQLVLLTLL